MKHQALFSSKDKSKKKIKVSSAAILLDASRVNSHQLFAIIHSLGAVVVVVLLFYVHGKHLRSCRDGQLT